MKKIPTHVSYGIAYVWKAACRVHTYFEEVKCLADNIYWGRNQYGNKAHIAIAFVVKNRVFDKRFLNTICEVVYQGFKTILEELYDLLLFAIAVNSVGIVMVESDEIFKVDAELYDEIKFLASAFLVKHEYLIDFTDGATHYHAYYVRIAWAKTRTFEQD